MNAHKTKAALISEHNAQVAERARSRKARRLADEAAKADAAVTKVARDILRLDTLEARNSDSLDFHEFAVWTIRDALIAAFNMGVAHANTR
jgi:division protein CdvB (Snf7/Vps24/ESCRT-III family)